MNTAFLAGLMIIVIGVGGSSYYGFTSTDHAIQQINTIRKDTAESLGIDTTYFSVLSADGRDQYIKEKYGLDTMLQYDLEVNERLDSVDTTTPLDVMIGGVIGSLFGGIFVMIHYATREEEVKQ